MNPDPKVVELNDWESFIKSEGLSALRTYVDTKVRVLNKRIKAIVTADECNVDGSVTVTHLLARINELERIFTMISWKKEEIVEHKKKAKEKING